MLRTCFECVVGGGGRQEYEEAAYGGRVNGQPARPPRAPVPAWPPPGKHMFLLPLAPAVGHQIEVGIVAKENPQRLDISLVTARDSGIDNDNVPCQLSIDFISNTVSMSNIVNGDKRHIKESTDEATSLITESEFSVTFTVGASAYSGAATVDVGLGQATVFDGIGLQCDLDLVRYLTVSGDADRVDSLKFLFS